MASLGAMSVEITADTSGLEKGAQRARGSLGSIGAKAGKVASKMAALGAAAAAAGAAMGAKLYSNGAKFIDQQAKMARTLDGSIDGLRALQIAASDAGTSESVAADAAQRLNGRLAEAERGTGRAAEALERLDLSASELKNMDVDERMAAIADRMNELDYSSGQAIDTLRDFGVRNREMALMLIDGGDAIRGAREEVDAFGLSLSEVDAAKVESANDAMGRIGRTMEGIQNAIAIEFAPLVNELSDRFNELSKENEGFGNIATQAAQSVSLGFAKVADIFRGVQIAIKGMEVIIVGVWRVFNNASLQIWESFSNLVDGITSGVNKVIRGMNAIGASIDEIPSMSNSQFMRDARRFDDELGQILADKNLELHELAATEMPSDQIMQFFEDVKKRSQEMAEQVIADRKKISGGGDGGEEGGEGDGEENKELKEKLNSQLEILRNAGKTEQEMMREKHATDLEILREALEQELISKQEYGQLAVESAARMEEQISEKKRREAENRARTEQWAESKIQNMKMQTAQMAVGLLGNIAGESKAAAIAQIALNKGLQIAQIIQNTATAKMRAMAELGPIAGPPAAASIAAMGATQVGIAAASGLAQAASAGGGGGGTSGVSSAVSSGQRQQQAYQEQQEKQTQRTLMVQGDFSPNQLFTGDTVRGLIDAIAEQQKDGYTVVV